MEIPQMIEDWIHDWLFKNVKSKQEDFDTHVRVTTFCRSIAYDLYTSLQDAQKVLEADKLRAHAEAFQRYTLELPVNKISSVRLNYADFIAAEAEKNKNHTT